MWMYLRHGLKIIEGRAVLIYRCNLYSLYGHNMYGHNLYRHNMYRHSLYGFSLYRFTLPDLIYTGSAYLDLSHTCLLKFF